MAEGQSRVLGALDVLAKIGIGVVGAWATLHFATIEAAREDQRDKLARLQVSAADERELIQIFADYAPKAASLATLEGRSALALTSYAAERLATEHSRPEFTDMLPAPSAAEVASAVAESPGAATAIRNVAMQAGEAQETRSATDNARWFAVAASFPLNDGAKAEDFAAKLRERLRAAAPSGPEPKVAIWRTRISRNLAVCVGGPLDAAGARDMARRLRTDGLVPDAFAQRDREWERLNAESVPGGLREAPRPPPLRAPN